MYYFNARWYDSNLGRFITEDPIKDGNNWYVYCSNNPLINIDPTGLEDTNYLIGDEDDWYNEYCLEDSPQLINDGLEYASQYYWDELGREPWWNIPKNAVNTVSFAVTGIAAALVPDNLMGLQELMYSGSLINQFSSLINASGTVVANKVTPFLSKFKNLFTKTDDAAGDLSKLLKTKPNKAFFWSGRYKNASGDMVSVMDDAAEIATQNGGHTLETLLKSKKVNLPEWNINDPASIKAWQDASASFANQVSGNVRAVIGSELRKGNIWQNVELPRLMSNANVKTISVINPQTKLEEIIFERLTK